MSVVQFLLSLLSVVAPLEENEQGDEDNSRDATLGQQRMVWHSTQDSHNGQTNEDGRSVSCFGGLLIALVGGAGTEAGRRCGRISGEHNTVWRWDFNLGARELEANEALDRRGLRFRRSISSFVDQPSDLVAVRLAGVHGSRGATKVSAKRAQVCLEARSALSFGNINGDATMVVED